MMEHFFTPYTSLSRLPGERVAVLAPHPDDEVFGCGATLAAMAAAGAEIRVVVVSGGGTFGEGAALTRRRREESEAAAAVLGYPAPQFWGLADGELAYSAAMMPRISAWLALYQPEVVLAPSPDEMHRDHRAVAEAALAVCARRGGPALAFYEVGQPLTPNRLVDITPHLASKRAAMSCFTSQLAMQDYDRHIEGLNAFRTYTLAKGVLAAEAFHWLSPQEIAPFIAARQPMRLSRVLHEAERTVLEAEQIAEQQRAAQKALYAENESQQAALSELRQRLAACENAHRALLDSRSVRLTRGMRWLARRFRRCRGLQ